MDLLFILGQHDQAKMIKLRQMFYIACPYRERWGQIDSVLNYVYSLLCMEMDVGSQCVMASCMLHVKEIVSQAWW